LEPTLTGRRARPGPQAGLRQAVVQVVEAQQQPTLLFDRLVKDGPQADQNESLQHDENYISCNLHKRCSIAVGHRPGGFSLHSSDRILLLGGAVMEKRRITSTLHSR